MPDWERKYMGRWKMPNDDYILRSDAKNAITDQWWAEIDRVPAADVEPKQRWIPVTERLPESAERYLVMRFDYVAKAPFYDLLWFENGKWWNRHFEGDYAVTHWMPLPEMPKEEKED